MGQRRKASTTSAACSLRSIEDSALKKGIRPTLLKPYSNRPPAASIFGSRTIQKDQNFSNIRRVLKERDWADTFSPNIKIRISRPERGVDIGGRWHIGMFTAT